MIALGLTGSIGMGKTTVTRQFALLGARTLNADELVHRLLAEGGAGVEPVLNLFPFARAGNAVDRKKLGQAAFADPLALDRLEAILHPLVRAEELAFLRRAKRDGANVAVMDIPLLFETGAEALCDASIVVTAPPLIQRLRVMARPGMTREKLAAVMSRQMADVEKRKRADYIIHTGLGKAFSFRQVQQTMMQFQ